MSTGLGINRNRGDRGNHLVSREWKLGCEPGLPTSRPVWQTTYRRLLTVLNQISLIFQFSNDENILDEKLEDYLGSLHGDSVFWMGYKQLFDIKWTLKCLNIRLWIFQRPGWIKLYCTCFQVMTFEYLWMLSRKKSHFSFVVWWLARRVMWCSVIPLSLYAWNGLGDF